MASALLYRQDIGEPTLHASDNGTIKGHRVDVPLPKEDDILKLKFKNDDDAMEWLTALVRYVERAEGTLCTAAAADALDLLR